MLFDLKGRRKRFIQVTYVGLAILFAVGLVGFGIGGGASGGLFDAISGKGGGGGSSGSSTYKKEVSKLQQRVRLSPKDKQAWDKLAQAHYNLARSSGDYDANTGQFSAGAANALAAGTAAWERYLALKPKKADPATAGLMLQSYATMIRLASGDPLANFKRAERAAEIIAQARPSPISFFNVAVIAYQIGDLKKADGAAKQAIRRTPKDQRNTVKSQLAEAKKQGLKAKKQIKKSKEQAQRAAQQAQKSGKDPFGAAPGQSPVGQ
jgi:tetratricopeptide (TPR) repeat protein